MAAARIRYARGFISNAGKHAGKHAGGNIADQLIIIEDTFLNMGVQREADLLCIENLNRRLQRLEDPPPPNEPPFFLL
jgi:hypothetical protein